MLAQENSHASPPRAARRQRRRWILFTVCGLFLLAAATCAIYLLRRPDPVPPLDAPPEKIIAFIATDRFPTLRESQQIPYVQRISSLSLPQLIVAASSKSLTDEQRQQAFHNGRNAWLALHSDECFRLPAGEKRDAYLDQLSQTMPMRIAAANGGWARNPGNKPLTPQMVKQWIEQVPPTRRALAAEFASELEKRGAFHN